MTQPLDPFAQQFDALTPSPLAGSVFEDALNVGALPEPSLDGPGFFLLDDADGRFAIERETGIITLASDEILEREHGAVYAARIRVREGSGETYEMNLRLRIDGRVPQIAENDTPLTLVQSTAAPVTQTPRAPAQAWAIFAASTHGAHAPLGLEDEPFGALIPFATALEARGVDFVPYRGGALKTAPHSARWSI
jgi:hypothetical protein